MEVALVDMGARLGSSSAYLRLDEIPFDADRMRISTVHATPEGPALYCKGALESVLPVSGRVLVDGEVRPMDRGLHDEIVAAGESMAEQGLRGLSETQLMLMLDTSEIIFARVSADQKCRIVEALKKNGTDVAKGAADTVLLDDNCASIVCAKHRWMD